MALIKDRKVACDAWCVLKADDPIPAVGDVIVPRSVWREQSQGLSERDGLTGVSLDPADDPADIGAMPTLRSDRPVPRLSKMATRPKVANRSSIGREVSHPSSTWLHAPGITTRFEGPSPNTW